jgi:hypothetical protein
MRPRRDGDGVTSKGRCAESQWHPCRTGVRGAALGFGALIRLHGLSAALIRSITAGFVHGTLFGGFDSSMHLAVCRTPAF